MKNSVAFIIHHSALCTLHSSLMQVNTILLPTDFSDCARYAVPMAAEFARLLGARVICLHVVEPVVPPVGWTPTAEVLPVADVGEQLDEAARRDLPRFADCEEFEGLDVEDLVVHGEASAEIVRVAEERRADMIIISSHGRTGLGRIIFGSTAEAVVRHAHCPVLVVKPPAKSDED
jgi:universal stress protein A